ncbi:MAG: hypothetical protein OXH66_14395 [Gemmatimonadetes bacterium]|nr:hypothetical protein [Gemmatimonadota bacterium]
MSSFSIQNVAAVDRPYEWGHAAARTAGALLWDFWNGPTDASRVAALEAQGRWRVGAGTAALPSLSFVDDPDSGFFRKAADRLGLALGGSEIVDFQATQVDVPGLKVNEVVYPGELGAAHQSVRLNSDRTALEWYTPMLTSGDGLDSSDIGDGLEIASTKLRVKLDGSSLARSSNGMKVSGSFTLAWSSITGKPSTFAPSAHTHPWSQITGAPSFFNSRGAYQDNTAYAVGDVVTDSGHLYYVATPVPDTNTSAPVDGSTWVLLSADPTPDASTSVKGKVELATQTEVNTGTDTARAVTPETLAGRLSSFFTDTIQPSL